MVQEHVPAPPFQAPWRVKENSFESVDYWPKPVLTIQDLEQQEVNSRTEFCDLRLLLSFVLVVCSGDLTTMTCTSSILT